MSELALTALDGADTIGGSKLLLEYDGKGVLLDFGTNFARMGTYYEEYLRPRSATGLLDHVTMGTLPDARGIFREDIMHPDLVLKGPEVVRVDAVLLSHAHVDHSGDIGFLRREIPVATSAMTAVIVKASQDSSRSELGREPAYLSERNLTDRRGAKVLRRAGNTSYGRDFFILDSEPSDDMAEFWGFLPTYEMATNKARAGKLEPGSLTKGLESISCSMLPVDHSIKGAGAFIVDTPNGKVVYTGDIRAHGKTEGDTRDFIERARSEHPYVMIVEGTRVRDDSCGTGTHHSDAAEKDVRGTARSILDGTRDKLVIADFGPRNIERLETFLDLANEARRTLVITTKDAYLLHAMHTVDSSVPVPGDGMRIYDSPKSTDFKFEEWIIQIQYPETLVRPDEIGTSPGDFLLSFSFFDVKHLIDIKPEGGHYIYSSSEAHNEEQEIDFRRLGAWLHRFGLKSHGFTVDFEGHPTFTCEQGPLHASGHASKEGIRDMIRAVEPEIVIPVHTQHPSWFEETFGDERRVIQPKRGLRVVL
jgi:ribonuclease J